MHNQVSSSCSAIIVIVSAYCLLLVAALPNNSASVCRRELDNANRSLTKWAETMESMVNESNLGPTVRDSIHLEANNVLDMIEDFSEQVTKSANPNVLAKDLVSIRRRANKLALDIYLNTFDMRWPQNSLQLGVIVERVQQACLDQSTIRALESLPNPLDSINR